MNGGVGEDIIAGSKYNDTINGGKGEDELYGNAGDDKMYGGDGYDYINGGDGNDLIKGEKGAYGIYITEVDGERAVYEHDKAYWALFINGEYAVSGIDATPIENGAQYTLAYTVG